MTVYAAYVETEEEDVIHHLTEPSMWGSCWGYFQGEFNVENIIPEDGKLHILSTIHQTKNIPAAKALLASSFYQNLTNGTVTVDDWNVEEWGGKRLDAYPNFGGRNRTDGVYIHIVADPTLAASRFITAMRLLTGDIANHKVKAELLPFVAFLDNAFDVDQEGCSDGGVSLYPSTAGQVATWWEDAAYDYDNDIHDVYSGEVLDNFASGEKWHITLEMLGRIWNRSSDEMQGLCSQVNPILFGGYTKDEEAFFEVDLNAKDSDRILTISAPVTDKPRPGETRLQDAGFQKALEYLFHNQTK